MSVQQVGVTVLRRVGVAVLVTLFGATGQAHALPTLTSLAGNLFHGTDSHTQQMTQAALGELDAKFVQTSDGTIYVSTGDIPAEWLRDSSVELRPYLFFVKSDAGAAQVIRSAVLRQARNLAIDPYANAFRMDYSIWEEKFEIDSLSYPLLLGWTYWKASGDATIFTPEVKKGFENALATMETEQDHASSSHYSHPDLSGNPVAKTGMIWSGFRPSDDPCQYNYLIPAEMMIVRALTALAEIETKVWNDGMAAARAEALALEVNDGIQRFGIVQTPEGAIYAYEVDGFGRANLMDDGNLPNLVGIPLLDYGSASETVVQNSRRFALSTLNPYYYQGKFAAGVGSPHTPAGMVWPLALLAELFTAPESDAPRILGMLEASDPGDHLLHESFDPNNPQTFTRADFGWPNALFVEYILTHEVGLPPLPGVRY